MKARLGCSEFEHFLAGVPSDSAGAEKRWCDLELFLSGTPSELDETEGGCRASARQAFFIPSNYAETVYGWKILAR